MQTDDDRVELKHDIHVGFAKVPFTESGLGMRGRPERPDGFTVHDDLHARAMVVESHGHAFCLISLDHACIERSEAVEIKHRVAQEAGIDARFVVTFCSHTHSDFDDWNSDRFHSLVARAAKEARQNVRPAEAACVRVDVPAVNVNRRVILPDGHGAFCIMYNDDCRFEGDRLNCTGNVRRQYEAMGADWNALGIEGPLYCDGPVDRTLHALLFREPTGRMLGSFVRFAAHACVVSPKHEHIGNVISADYPGVLCANVEEKFGGVCLFGNGPCGNIRILYRENTFAECERIGRILSSSLIEEAGYATFATLSHAELRRKEIRLPVTTKFPPSVEEAERRLQAVKQEILEGRRAGRNIREIRRLNDRHAFLSSKLRLLKGGARNPAFLDECLSGALTRDIHCACFNDASFAALPGEIFTQIGQRLVEHSHRDNFFVVSLANGFVPYQPTSEEIDTGAYEVKERIVRRGADELLIEEALKLCS